MTSSTFKNLLDKYSRGECTAEEEKLILLWYDQIKPSEYDDLPEKYKDLIQARLWAQLKPSRKHQRGSWFGPTQKVAAAIVCLVLAAWGAFALFNQYLKNGVLESAKLEQSHSLDGFSTFVNKDNKPREIRLEDGSAVTLQPQSEVRLPSFFAADKREVYLTGEAFFQVSRDTLRPFLVYSNEVVTRVLGTSFTVKAYKDSKDVTVAVRSGKVSVYKRTVAKEPVYKAQEVILAPNQQAIYQRDHDKVLKQLVEKPEIILPQPTLFEMEYDGASVVKIFQVLEENYGIDIVYDEAVLKGCNLTTSLSDEGLYERIKIICEAIGAQYEVLNENIVIKSTGCTEPL